MVETYPKNVKINCIEKNSSAIVWIYPRNNKSNMIIYSKKNQNSDLTEITFNEPINNLVTENELISFDKFSTKENYLKILPKKWVLQDSWDSNKEIQGVIDWIDLELDHSAGAIKIWKENMRLAEKSLCNFKSYTYYSSLVTKKSKVFIHKKEKYSLKHKKKVTNFLLCFSKYKLYLPELNPIILKFISYV